MRELTTCTRVRTCREGLTSDVPASSSCCPGAPTLGLGLRGARLRAHPQNPAQRVGGFLAHLSCPHWAWGARAGLSRARRLDRSAPLWAFRARVKVHCTVMGTKDSGPPEATPWGQAKR